MPRIAGYLFALALLQSAIAQPTGQGVMSGTVLDAVNNQPVRRAVVTLTWRGTPRSWATTRTDGAGKFRFEGLPAGKYDLSATKSGFGTATYGANRFKELGEIITLEAGENRADLKLKFLRFAVISGRVMDRDGDPVTNVQVMLMRPGRNLGEKILTNYRGTSTDDRGQYRIAGVDPGDYYILCTPGNMQPMGPVGPARREMLVQQYFPAARDAKEAKVLTLYGGDTLNGIDFHLITEQPAKISGRVVNIPAFDPPPAVDPSKPMNAETARQIRGQNITVEVSPADSNQMQWNQNTGANPPEYRFTSQDVAPGRYRVHATVRAKDRIYSATQVVEAAAGNNEIVLTLSPNLDIKGSLKTEGPRAPAPESFTVALNPPPNSGGRRENHSSPVAKDGTFTIKDVPPGEWMLAVSSGGINPSLPGQVSAFYEKSVRLGDKEYAYKRIEIPPGSDVPLNIVESSNTAIVEGEVDAGGGDPKRAGIILGPTGVLRNLARFYYGTPADDAGKFRIAAVAPGKYKVYALEKIAVASYRNPESVDLLEELGEEVEVTEGGRIQLHPKLIPIEKAREILKP